MVFDKIKEIIVDQLSGYGIGELLVMPIDRLSRVMKELSLGSTDTHIVEQVMLEIDKRLDFLVDVGVGYLSVPMTAPAAPGRRGPPAPSGRGRRRWRP